MIIWIASYPKSGNTWVRSLLSSYLYSEDGVFNFDLLRNIDQFPNQKSFDFFLKDLTDIKKVSQYWIAAQDKINLKGENIFLKTHSALCTLENNSFTNKNNTKAVIYVVRDPRNVITSVSNHFSKSIEESYTFITNSNKLLTNEEWGKKTFGITSVLGSWSDHYNSWRNINFAPILIVKYENLLKDTKNSLIEIIKFLSKFIDIKINDQKIMNAVNSCSFENLARKERTEGFFESVYSKKDNDKINFFHLGKKNDWRTLLNSEFKNKIRISFKKEMIELSYI